MTTGWTYRIVKKEGKYGVYPVFIDDNQDVVNIHNMPIYLKDSMLELQAVQDKAGKYLFLLLKEAWDYPVIDYNTGE